MADDFLWNDAYSVGRSDIDMQHQRLFALANTLPDALDIPTWRRLVMELFKYTRIHFSAEEQMMLENGYPKLAEHCALHEELIGQLAEVSAQSQPSPSTLAAFKPFFFRWIIEHILTRDMDYLRFIQKKGL